LVFVLNQTTLLSLPTPHQTTNSQDSGLPTAYPKWERDGAELNTQTTIFEFSLKLATTVFWSIQWLNSDVHQKR